MAQDLTLQLEKLTNQVKFVQMIIKKELNVSGRKKAEIIRDLKSKGFKAFPKVAKVEAEGRQRKQRRMLWILRITAMITFLEYSSQFYTTKKTDGHLLSYHRKG